MRGGAAHGFLPKVIIQKTEEKVNAAGCPRLTFLARGVKIERNFK
jgi:hypothetical protein